MMFTRGSRIFFALALSAYLGGVLYGIITNGVSAGGVVVVMSGNGAVNAFLGPITFGYKGGVGDHLGYILFMSFAVCSLGTGLATSAFRDGDPEAVAELANADSAPPLAAPNDLSQWPVVAGFAATLMTLGLATNPVLFSIGAGALAIAAFEWTIKDWSEQATGDPEVNRAIRNRLMLPVELPIAGVLLIAITVFSFSRILLTSSQDGAVVAAALVGLVIFAVGVIVSTRPQVRRGLIVGVVVVGAAVVLGLGIFGAVKGQHPLEHEGGGTKEHAAAPAGANYSVAATLGETE